MPIQKLTSTNAFVAIDLEGVPAAGVVRCAPKILQGGAKDLARSLTYTFAAFEMKRSGASAGINAAGDARGEAIAAFVEELTPEVAAGDLSISAAKGVEQAELAALSDADDRHPIAGATVGDDDLATHLAGLGPVIAAERVLGDLGDKRVAIEGFGVHGPALADAAVARGARIVAVSTAKGAMTADGGIDASELRGSWHSAGEGMVGDEAPPAWKVFGADTDVLFTGSKMGAINHDTASSLTASAVIPHAQLPYTARALAVMTRADIVAVPDFLATAGPVFAWWPQGGTDDAAAVVADASAAISAVLDEAAGHEDGAFLGACQRAETFLSTWRDELPFGRPLAS